jgi:hypothetical protein
VVARSDERALSARALDRGFDSRLWHDFLLWSFLCCVVLYRYRPSEELICRPRSPTVCRKNCLENQKWSQDPHSSVEHVRMTKIMVMIMIIIMDE